MAGSQVLTTCITSLLLFSHTSAAELVGWTLQGGGLSTNVKPHDTWVGSRSGAASWLDPKGDLWLFGGYGLALDGRLIYLNDLWHYNHAENKWHVVNPDGVVTPPGRYMGSACGVPGIMFVVSGGLGVDDLGFTDTWVYSMMNNTWLLLSKQTGNNSQAHPLARGEAATWCTRTDMFVFGGIHQGSLVGPELWRFSLETLTWAMVLTPGEGHRSQGEESPSERNGALTWVTENGLYLYGGNASSVHSGTGYSSDLWRYSEATNNWTLLYGKRFPSQPAAYGKQLYCLNTTSPGGRKGSATWVDASGNLWLYGGETVKVTTRDRTESRMNLYMFMEDVWFYSPGANCWAWKSGKTHGEEPWSGDVYHMPGLHFSPGARYGSTSWRYGNRFYIFAGATHSPDMSVKYLYDVWFMKVFPWIVPWSVGRVLTFFVLVLVLIVAFVIIAMVAKRAGGRGSFQSPKYSLLTESTSFDQ